MPQLCTHGSLHFKLMQALLRGQSEFTAHSGLQAGGTPRNPTLQEQAARSFAILHSLFGPQGDGSHGLNGVTKKNMNLQPPPFFVVSDLKD